MMLNRNIHIGSNFVELILIYKKCTGQTDSKTDLRLRRKIHLKSEIRVGFPPTHWAPITRVRRKIHLNFLPVTLQVIATSELCALQ
jgi:hypothetical protein